eukprot:COSAG02_NODE_214_length_28689_cov_34.895523_12_plen_83_part_00
MIIQRGTRRRSQRVLLLLAGERLVVGIFDSQTHALGVELYCTLAWLQVQNSAGTGTQYRTCIRIVLLYVVGTSYSTTSDTRY